MAKRISTASGKAKGRKLQTLVRDKLLSLSDSFREGDIESIGMGQSGEDLVLSPHARDMLPVSIECKARAKLQVYSFVEQCKSNCPDGCQPVVVVKGDYKKPLAVIDLDYWVYLEGIRLKHEESYNEQ